MVRSGASLHLETLFTQDGVELFKLREGLKYSDGTEVKASDFENTMKRLLKLGSPTFLLKRIGVAFETKVRPGKMLLVESRERFGVSEIHGVVLPPYVCARTAPAWAARALEMSGARDVETVHVACRHRGDDCCRYETRWS